MSPWEWLLGGLGGFVIIPYLWFKGKGLEEKTEQGIKLAGYISLAVICLFILVVISKWSK